MAINISKEEIRLLERLNIISQMVPIKEKIRLFEQKYDCDFKTFENRIQTEEEDFQKWDDYIEWKAYTEKLKDLELTLKEMEDAQDFKIT